METTTDTQLKTRLEDGQNGNQTLPPHHSKIIKDQSSTINIIDSNIAWML